MLQNRSYVVADALDGPRAPGRLAGRGPIAVIDIGSNSVRLVIYERLSRTPSVLFNEKVLAGLGRGIGATGKLAGDSVTAALDAIRRFKFLADQGRCVEVHILATAAARDAANGKDFLDAVESICGVPVTLLSGADEARLSALGVVSGFLKPTGVVGDLGGGSLELVALDKGAIGEGRTYPLGGIRLEEDAEGSIRKAEKLVEAALAGAGEVMGGAGQPFYAVGGTWRSLARLHMFEKGYPLHVMHHYSIAADEALEFSRIVARRDPESIDQIGVVSKSRRGLLPFGALVLEQVLRVLRPSEVVISALGVREGHLYELLDPAEQAEDPLLEACAELAYLRSRSPRHAEELIDWTADAFAALGIEETPEEARLRAAGCLVSDIGWRAHPDYRGEQSLNIVAHGSFIGIDHPGRAYLALSNYFRHIGIVDEAVGPRIRELASTRVKERARTLGAALRVAYLISASMPGVVPATSFDTDGDRLVLKVPAALALIDGDRLKKRLTQLAKLGGMKDGRVQIVG
ncbi:Ppx/GppA phosphatase family protein [Methylobrevis albus]|uniref:Ppx/GppA family phosphatase n=1 Tax=Methylobrevis albus TaxID=2793297 RepID=A0A931I6Y7_9HYPH|nr:Ppx/GppA phosphatase family protein [Methylobrevis albus]MBH0239938.1 Ppx/GppA family phosphatase [Methylobrevis albus]